MKIAFTKRGGDQGSIILVSLVVAAVAGITLASYLILAETQTVSVYRSQSWNSSLPVTEAGIEDALQLINRYAGSMEPEDIPKWTNHVTESNWETLGSGVYHVKRHLPFSTAQGNWFTNSYDVWITNAASPIIYATATVPWTHYYASAAPQSVFASIGLPLLANMTTTEPVPAAAQELRRNVDVKTMYDPLFNVAMAALETIDLKGNNITTDSFDSADPNFSDNGKYPSHVNKTRANGSVCTSASLIDSIDMGNANIKGRVKTGPGVDTIEIGPNGSVGDRAWVESGTDGIKPGWAATDFNAIFNTVEPPGVTPLPKAAVPQVVDGTTYQYVFSSDGWYYPAAGISGNVLFNAPTNHIIRLIVYTPVSLSGQTVIRVANTGVKVRIYMAGNQFSLTGQACIDNQSGAADRFYLYGLKTCKSITFSGNASFCGGIYAPQAAFTLGGGGADVYDFVGASVTRTVTMNGKFRFHYDENLRRLGPGRGYIPVSWKEM
ncbi:MAG TPA: hypothetical protein VN673_17950 [Clostridia bacterium]|nr:hypothetical protein [Clostridia bacterium]